MDSLVSQQVLSSGVRRDSFLCAYAHKIWLIAAASSDSVKIIHKKGASLVLADALSTSLDSSQSRRLEAELCAKCNLKELTVEFSLKNVEFSW